MASKERPAGEDAVRAFFWPIHAALHLAVWLVIVMFLSVVASLAVAVGLQSEQAPSRYMGDLVEYYLDQAPNKQVANDVAGVSRALVFGWPGVATALSSEANPAAPSLLGGALQRSTRGEGRELILVTMHAVELLGVRLMLLFSALPALALLLAVALIDGLVARYVRRECGGHESATRHTRAKRLLNRGIVPMVAVVWLIVPAPMSLAMFFFPVAVGGAGLVWVMAKYFKKYL
ncbi:MULTISPECIES: DUF4400 domain-containing protein [Achromobacter]|uniref:DUF4400 domain-containing protein n=2 Tax=Achromobacter TaxID=222 RepID=A0A424WJ58_ALCXX|nr:MULTISPECIES: DUF4400 domain-containing protein [Achromobacter]MBC9904605.1 DUF4400 domain-containing protein [Achromobacter xylosoxidans]MBD0868147.1 DUF4400 domain-containing protein [Achromobacter xylosoxidans]QNP85475.1 DUF4400 domain-containing protein [Achromobacter xylosoxidans]RPJ93305.1 DUF4400 domain-containing protein [Achromobacter xylosoxidans]CAB3936245.1 hypothetical protein LMG6000_04784 [Achromobacter insolitus]